MEHDDESGELQHELDERERRLEDNRRRLEENRQRREAVARQQEEVIREREAATKERLAHFRSTDKWSFVPRLIGPERKAAGPPQNSEEFWRKWREKEATIVEQRRKDFAERNRPFQEERQRLEAMRDANRLDRERSWNNSI